MMMSAFHMAPSSCSSVTENRPLGSVASPARARRSPSAKSEAIDARNVSTPWLAASWATRDAALRLAATCAHRSPRAKAGRRELAAMMSKTEAIWRPASNSRTAGSLSPS